MRPRLNAGDDERELILERTRAGLASMRPRLNAGDDTKASDSCRISSFRFNEAPAKCRG